MRADGDVLAGGRHVVFRLGEHSYALAVESIEEIVPAAELSRPSTSPALLAGFLNIGGRLIAAISLRRLWGMPDEPPGLYTPLIILKASPTPIAIEVDAATHIIDLDEAELTGVAEGSALNDCATALVRLDVGPALVLAADRLLLKQEQRRLADLAGMERQRLAAFEEAAACPK